MKRAFSVGSYVHITKRGVRGLPIVKDDNDKWRFLRMLRYFNNQQSHKNWKRDVRSAGAEGHHMPWPSGWRPQKPLVQIHAYTLMPNHFHLLTEEIVENGIARFMKKVSDSMTKSFNKKYDQEGSLFQGPYKSSIVDTDQYLRFVYAYALVKNVFELYPEGFATACRDFDTALHWAAEYPFSSLASQLDKRKGSPITADSNIQNIFTDSEDFTAVAREAVRFSEAKKLRDTDIHLE
jgi:putative transposase